MTPRCEQLKAHIHAALSAGARRTTFYPLVAESLRQTRGEPRPIRRAKAFAYLLDRVEQAVLPHELVAGSIMGMWPVATGMPAYEERLAEARRVVAARLDARQRDPRQAPAISRWALMGRDHYDANIAFPDLQRIAQTLAQDDAAADRLSYAQLYRMLEDHFQFDYGADVRAAFAELPWFVSNHLYLNYGKALIHGLNGLRRRILDKQSIVAPESQEFYASVRLTVDAAIRFIHRYAETLRAEAARIADAGRASELRQMSGICDLVAESAPRTFREALQLTWLLHVIANVGGGSALSLGRLDQSLYPFYRHDAENGLTNRDQARELLSCVFLKVNEPKMRTVQSLCLSGVDREGRDATNALTFLCLEAAAETGEPYPNTAVRLSRRSPARLWDTVVAALAHGAGQPMIFNDDVMLPGLEDAGYPPADARDYYPMGCVEIMLHGVQPTYRGSGTVVFPGELELVFTNGEPNLAGERGLRTGELSSFGTFEAFLEAFLAQVTHRATDLMTAAEDAYRKHHGKHYDPFASALVDDCLEKGRDICEDGARYPRCFTVNSMGLGTAVDSLAAIKTAVFDRGLCTLARIKEVLDRDFDGEEAMRRLLAATPGYGNDVEEVDAIAQRVYDAFVNAVRGFASHIGAVHIPQMFSYHSHVYRGEVTAATPNGRRRATAFSDGMGPSQGKDTRGPTSLINSVTRLDYRRLVGGAAFNLKLNPDLVSDADGRANLKALLRTYLDKGGVQIQVNMVDGETLRAAQERPEEYGHIVVRVAGFCEYFTSLDRKLQDEIIQRTTQSMAGGHG